MPALSPFQTVHYNISNGKSNGEHIFFLHLDDYNLMFRESTESCFRHPLFDLRGTRKVEIRHTNFHFSSKNVISKSRKVEVFDLTIVKKLSTFRPKKAKVEKLKSRSKSGKFFDNCQVKNFSFSTFRGNFFARKVEVSVPNVYFSSSS